MKRRVRLLSVTGEEPEEYADLIGTEGTLAPAGAKNGLTFMPANRTDWITLATKRQAEKNGKVTVSTRFGNTFTFRLL